ncbi:hypothetical protein HpBGD112_15350 [Helicobacter pylori]
MGSKLCKKDSPNRGGDLDKTTTSHQVAFELGATSALQIKYQVASLLEAKRFLNSPEAVPSCNLHVPTTHFL